MTAAMADVTVVIPTIPHIRPTSPMGVGMRILRSWPKTVPPGRPHVVDNLPRLMMDEYDYRVLSDVDDDVLLLEWDIAIGREDLQEFARRAQAEPDRVMVAPYRLYHYASEAERPHGIWAHRRYIGTPEAGRLVHAEPGDPYCHLFGLGMAYLPRAAVTAYLAAWPDEHFSDVSFSGWHYRNIEPRVPITWDIRPVHLHYSTGGLAQ